MTTTKFLDSPAELKFIGDTGAVEGYASIFNNVDRGGDMVLPGAFKEVSKTRDGHVLMLYQHRSDAPIGKAEVAQDSVGLHFKAQLVLDDPTARRAYTHMRNGLLDGMSIGYEVLPGGANWKGDHRELSALRLHEISAVTFGMNPEARIEGVKTALTCENPRELERLLRDIPEFQLSSRRAKAAANALWPILSAREAQEDARDERGEKEAVLAFATTLDQLSHLLKGI